MDHLTYLQAIVLGLLQGVTELFPISSLGHSVLIPEWLGGSWANLVTGVSASESPYLAFIVGLHVATALALLVLYARDWAGIVTGFFTSLRYRRVSTTYERMAWLIIIATIPAGLTGLAFEHALRTLFAKPAAAAVFLTLNGVVLLGGELLRRRAPRRTAAAVPAADDVPASAVVGASGAVGVADVAAGVDPPAMDTAIASRLGVVDVIIIGVLQIFALFAGLSRSGLTMVGGLLRGLDHEESVRFAFLLATPVILAAGLLKIPDLMGPLGNGIRGQALAGAAAAFVAALASAVFLVRWFKTRTLTPFAIYCLVVGGASIIRFG